MGKATIISEVGDGKYLVQPVFDDSLALAYIASLEVDNATLDARIAALPDEITEAVNALSAAIAALRDLITAIVGGEATDAQRESIDKKQLEVLILEQELASKRSALSLAKLKKESNLKKIAYLQENAAQPDEMEAWCADYTVGAVGDVGTIEIGRRDTPTIIKPAAAAHNNAADGMLQPTVACSPSAFFYNYALLPAAAKWKPRYQTGYASNIDGIADTMTVNFSLNPLIINGISCNLVNTLHDVPVSYMTCHASAFHDDDHVIVEFLGDNDTPRVIGFVDNPAQCGVAAHIRFDNSFYSDTPTPDYTHGIIKKNYEDTEYIVVGEPNVNRLLPNLRGGWIDWRGGNGDVVTYSGPKSRYGVESIKFQHRKGDVDWGVGEEGVGGFQITAGAFIFVNAVKVQMTVPSGNVANCLGYCTRTISGKKYLIGVFPASKAFTTRYHPPLPGVSETYNPSTHWEAKVYAAVWDYTAAEQHAAYVAGGVILVDGAYNESTNPRGWFFLATIPWAFATEYQAELAHPLTGQTPYTYRNNAEMSRASRGMAYWSQDGTKFIQRIGNTTSFRECFFATDGTLDRIEFIEGRYYNGIQRRSSFGSLSTPSFNFVRSVRGMNPDPHNMQDVWTEAIVPADVKHGCALYYDYQDNILVGLFVRDEISITNEGTSHYNSSELFFATEGSAIERQVYKTSTTGTSNSAGNEAQWETVFEAGGATAHTVVTDDFHGFVYGNAEKDHIGIHAMNWGADAEGTWLPGNVQRQTTISGKGRGGIHWADIRFEAVAYTYNYRNLPYGDWLTESRRRSGAGIVNRIGMVIWHQGSIVHEQGYQVNGSPVEKVVTTSEEAWGNYNSQEPGSGLVYNHAPFRGYIGEEGRTTTTAARSATENVETDNPIRSYFNYRCDEFHFLDMIGNPWDMDCSTFVTFNESNGTYLHTSVIDCSLTVAPELGVVGHLFYTPRVKEHHEVITANLGVYGDIYGPTYDRVPREPYPAMFAARMHSGILPTSLADDICATGIKWYADFAYMKSKDTL